MDFLNLKVEINGQMQREEQVTRTNNKPMLG